MSCANCGHEIEKCLDGWFHANKLPSGAWYHGKGCSMGIKRECPCREPMPEKEGKKKGLRK